MVAATTLDYATPIAADQWVGTPSPQRPRVVIARPSAPHTATGLYTDVIGLNGEFAGHFEKLRAIRTNQALWPEGAQAPSGYACDWASIMLQRLQRERLLPTRVVASAEGGVAICFIDGNKYADVEFLNTGEILGVTSDRRNRPVVWEAEPSASDLARATDRIRMFLRGYPTVSDGSTLSPSG